MARAREQWKSWTSIGKTQAALDALNRGYEADRERRASAPEQARGPERGPDRGLWR